MGKEGNSDIDTRTGGLKHLRRKTGCSRIKAHTLLLLGQCRKNNAALQIKGASLFFISFFVMTLIWQSVQIGEVVTTIPTIGFNVEFVDHLRLGRRVSDEAEQICHIRKS